MDCIHCHPNSLTAGKLRDKTREKYDTKYDQLSTSCNQHHGDKTQKQLPVNFLASCLMTLSIKRRRKLFLEISLNLTRGNVCNNYTVLTRNVPCQGKTQEFCSLYREQTTSPDLPLKGLSEGGPHTEIGPDPEAPACSFNFLITA